MDAMNNTDQEDLVEALARAEAANNAKTQFLTNMSHDIRTPMNAITGFISLALGCLDDKQQVREYLIKAAISSQHLLELIDDILDMSKIDSGKIQLEKSVCSINEIINDLQTVYSVQTQSKQQEFTISTDITDDVVLCDKLRLDQVLGNLLSNAVKFTPIGGKISLNVKQVLTEKGSGRYEFHVKDTGIGMSEEFLPKLFNIFERENTSTISRTQGTGLGMAISKRIIDMMGGEIQVQSKPGKGTEFVVILHFEIADKEQLSYKTFSDEELGDLNFDGKRILLVEDNSLNSEIAQTILENHGFLVELVENGAEAVAKYKAATPGTYDIILMDIQMPVMDGYQATREIRKYEATERHTPIIAMTANVFEEDRLAALDAGMDDHIPKPIDIPYTIRTIRKFLR